MNELWKAIDQHGIGLAGMVALAFVIYKKGIPWAEQRFSWFEKRVETLLEESKKDHQEFMEALVRRDLALAKRDDAFEEMSDSLKRLACHNLAAIKKKPKR